MLVDTVPAAGDFVTSRVGFRTRLGSTSSRRAIAARRGAVLESPNYPQHGLN